MTELSASAVIDEFEEPPDNLPEQCTTETNGALIDGEQANHSRVSGDRPEYGIVTAETQITQEVIASTAAPAVGKLAVQETTTIVGNAALEELFRKHNGLLTGIAQLMLGSIEDAEDVVQDSYTVLHGRGILDLNELESYARSTVLNRSRNMLRHRGVVERKLPKLPPNPASAEVRALELIERSEVVAALRKLPDRQREAIVLRYYADLSEAEIAATMGIALGTVKAHIFHAMTHLEEALRSSIMG